jgi:hypothetical protein
MRWLYLVVTSLILAGCGADWFPAYQTTTTTTTTGGAAAPNFFNFTSQSVTINDLANSTSPTISSNTVTITGNNPQGWPISFKSYSGATSQLTIGDNSGGLSYTYDPGTAIPNILPNQTIQIQQTPSFTVGGFTITAVTVGSYTTNFIIATVQ